MKTHRQIANRIYQRIQEMNRGEAMTSLSYQETVIAEIIEKHVNECSKFFLKLGCLADANCIHIWRGNGINFTCTKCHIKAEAPYQVY